MTKRELDEILGNATESRIYDDEKPVITNTERLYIEGIIVARRWRDESVERKSDEQTIKAFNRILNEAISEYEHLFNKKI